MCNTKLNTPVCHVVRVFPACLAWPVQIKQTWMLIICIRFVDDILQNLDF